MAGNSSVPTTSMTASIVTSIGPIQLGDQLHPGHDMPFGPRAGGLRDQFLVHGRRRGRLLVVALDFGRGLPLFNAVVDLGRLAGFGRFGPRLGRARAALLPPPAAPALALAALLPLRTTFRLARDLLALVF